MLLLLQPYFVGYNLVAFLEALCAQIFFLDSRYRTCLYESEIWTGHTLNSTIIALSVPSTGFVCLEVEVNSNFNFIHLYDSFCSFCRLQ